MTYQSYFKKTQLFSYAPAMNNTKNKNRENNAIYSNIQKRKITKNKLTKLMKDLCIGNYKTLLKEY